MVASARSLHCCRAQCLPNPQADFLRMTGLASHKLGIGQPMVALLCVRAGECPRTQVLALADSIP